MHIDYYTIVLRNVGREISDVNWQTTEPSHITAWKEAQILYELVHVNHLEHNIDFAFDFSAAIDDLEHRYAVMQRFIINGDRSAINDFRSGEVRISCKASSTSDKVSHRFSSASQYVEYFAYEMFIAMNIAAPGCCDFDAAFMTRDGSELNAYGKQITYDILLSNRAFEAATYEEEHFPWLALSRIPVAASLAWLKIASPRFSMVPRTPIARCLYSLFYIASSDYSPASVSWVFYALESLFQCRPGENFNVLTNRISLLLSLDADQAISLRKKLRKLYDVRSSFIHGGADIAHPMRNEVLDRRVEDVAWQNIPLTDFGVAVILRCLQELIKRNASEVAFEETLHFK